MLERRNEMLRRSRSAAEEGAAAAAAAAVGSINLPLVLALALALALALDNDPKVKGSWEALKRGKREAERRGRLFSLLLRNQ